MAEESVKTAEIVSKKTISKKYLFGALAVLLVIASVVGIYFYQNQQAQAVNQNSSLNNRNQTQRNAGQNRANFANLTGNISSITDKNLILDVSDNGGQRIVLLSDTAQITKMDDASKDDILKIDQNVSIQTDKNGNTTTAKTVTLRPIPVQNGQNINGTQFDASNRPNRANNGGQNRIVNPNNPNRQNQFQNMVFGKITKIDGDNVTIQNISPNNTQSETTVVINADTKFKQQTNLKITDLKTNQNVSVAGLTDASGTITARNIIIE